MRASYPGYTEREMEEIRALNGSRPHARRWSPPSGTRMWGVNCHPAAVRKPWVVSIPDRGSRSKFVHRPGWALIAWRGQTPRRMMVQFRCGRATMAPVLLDEPGEWTVCPRCLLATGEGEVVRMSTSGNTQEDNR